MSAADHAKAIEDLMTSLAATYTPEPPPERTAMEHLVHAFLLWESTTPRADNAMKRLSEAFVDMNELRVSRPVEIMALIGKTYPRLEERVLRLRAALKDIYLREHSVSLEAVISSNKRDGRKYLESLEGANQFIMARAALLALGSHAIPVDDRLLAKLIAGGIFEPDTTPEKAGGLLERYIKASDGVNAHLLLQAFSEDNAAEPETLAAPKTRRRSRSSSGSKKSAATKPSTSRKKPSRKSKPA